MTNMSLALKSGLLTAIIIGLLVIQIVTIFFTSNKIKSNSEFIANNNIPLISKSLELKLAIVQVQQWLTDISATRGLDGLNDGFSEAEKHANNFNKLIQDLQTLDPDDKQVYAKMVPAFDAYYSTGIKMAKAYIADGTASGNKIMGEFDTVAANLAELVDPFLEKVNAQSDSMVGQQQQAITNTKLVSAATSLVLFAITVLAALFINNIVRKILSLRTEMQRIADGDLRGCNVTDFGDDELSLLCRSTNDMRIRLKDMMSNISNAATRMQEFVGEMRKIADESREVIHAEQQDINMIATAITEMSSSMDQMAQSAEVAAESVNKAEDESRQGYQVVQGTVNAINTLANEVNSAAETILSLQEDSHNIGGILDVIRGIAEQTNLLALNAAIEAARAGDQGRGFAVVADEVRTLAQRTQQSTAEIQSKIEKLQHDAQDAVTIMTRGRNQAKNSVEQAQSAGHSLQSITQTVSTIARMNKEIALASEQQHQVSEEINRSILHISSATEHAVKEADQTSVAGEHLMGLADDLNNLILQVKM